MKIAVISDIHGNSWALEAVLADIGSRSVDRVVNLGDHFYGPIAPAETWQLLRELDCITLCGNQDRMLFAPGPDAATLAANPTFRMVIDELGEQPLSWLSSLPSAVVLAQGAYLCHGAPGLDDLYLLEDIATGRPAVASNGCIGELLGKISTALVLCGHTHIPRTVQLSSGQLVVNPGSVGLQAYEDEEPVVHKMENFSPHARYAIVEQSGAMWQVAQISVPYDWEAAACRAEARGRADWAYYLRTGRVSSGT